MPPLRLGHTGRRVYGKRSGQRRPRTSLIAAHRKGQLLAPALFEGTATTDLVNQWTEQMLMKELNPASTLIYDNARFHKEIDLKAIAEKNGHHLLFLPAYSPDLSPIENDFANIKAFRDLQPSHTPLDTIIKMYGN